MYFTKSFHGHQAILPLLYVLLSHIDSIEAQSNATCTPLNCVALCSPTCNDTEACILKTMKNCAQCPSSVCIGRSVLGLPPKQTVAEIESGSDHGGMIGGIVGGLLGLGIVMCAGVYLYIKKGKKKGKLPFAFTDGSANPSGMLSQEQFSPISPPLTPHPGVVAALSHQQREANSRDSYLRNSHQPKKYIGLAELASMSSSNAPSTSRTNSFHTSLSNTNNNDTIVTSPISSTTVPEEFEEKIALQNKRISHILNNNPRLSQSQPLPLPIYDGNRQSIVSDTTDDDSEYEYESRPAVVLQRKPTIQAVQVSRAKPQIVRVNSVRTIDNNNLSRSNSVRTVITSLAPLPMAQEDLTNQFPATPTNRSFVDEDPFLDEKPKY